ncbi:hypothetical protein ACF1BE_03760 [Streptomyces sp. NPDC014991]|uniref:hypothetical protein n=1 Tax=Streptomyces sp. NPDC014991 TaxID=3364935 RepID=UPI0036F62B5E
MRKFLGPLPRATAGALAPAVLSVPAAARAGASPSPEAARVAFARRHRAVRLGRFVRAGNASTSCRSRAEVRRSGVRAPGGAGGRVGLVAYDGVRGRAGDALTFSAGHRRTPVALGDSASPAYDVPDYTINEPGAVPARRVPAYANTLGHDSDVSDLGVALRHGGDQPGFPLVPHADAAWAGAALVAVNARQ